MDGERTLAEVCSLMVVEFDADPEQIRQDLLELIEQLEEIGALQCARNPAREG
jgi:hypothetical protein